MMGVMACDFLNCGNPISARCNLCGRSMCVRHIQWIGARSTGYNRVTSGHYRCDICSHQMIVAGEKEQAKRAKIANLAVKLTIFGVLVFAVGMGGDSVFPNVPLLGGLFTFIMYIGGISLSLAACIVAVALLFLL